MDKHKILIIEDDHPLADLMKMNFPKEQFDTACCYSGEEALREIQKNRPELIILDVVMPKMDGWEVLKKIKSNPLSSSIPVIMCTAKDNVGDVEKSFHYGAQAFVIKPVIFKKLIKKVEAILDLEEMLND
ncbi:MAG: hypothetical protein A3I11_03240 [Elusimicrobia bacterium RIFCSPLOWO2_02_FULL_39_32]|nr:MAG: hypothetical protein A2034_00845 [Elusimicrobia bacterium GWA2_38_7]OGR79397.1 MAG: hypothetical protein A3B80_01810 [Elusimicrobia bacterium RIFCSPHIGHO2_02_FULL_39_36]OGR92724.1 MAG: hypothetical protein A3I11_03240 [Elusimicrobia bacterium RIFCSPLOWO2_02_FULL_39_32]OGR99508.1 MAG: hypothetical protein A3G85_00595 [Elusimicrobia bacterium RIFCSPLOWO2_12_FULL_39_28]